MKLIRSPWDDTFFDLLLDCHHYLQITSPYVKAGLVNQTLSRKNPDLKIELVTSLKVNDFYQKSSDLSAIKNLIETNNSAYRNQSLHAKIYIFDKRKALITSGNWTFGGLTRNYEYGVLIDEVSVVTDIVNDFEQLKINESTIRVEHKHIIQMEHMVEKLTLSNTMNSLSNNSSAIIANEFSGWKRDVFDIINSLKQDIVQLDDILAFVPFLQEKHPANNHVQAKIRQQLQKLRDIGLVDFLGNGVYKKLW